MENIIDFHHHLLEEEGYADKLVKKMDDLSISKVCISGLGIGKGKICDNADYKKFNLGSLSPDNDDVYEAIKKYPERLIGMGVINLGRDTKEKVDELVEKGFKGFKITRPLKDYNSEEFFPIYEKIEKLGMPILFHTGIILTTPFDKQDDVCSDRMRPIKLDRVARNFPDLKIVMAHLGVPWFEEAAIVARFHKNVFVDFTGSSMGWRNRMSPIDFLKLFYWEDAFKKVIFGTDTHINEMADSLYDQTLLFNLLNLNQETKRLIFSGNAELLLNL